MYQIFRIRQFTGPVSQLASFKCKNKFGTSEFQDGLVAIGSGYVQPNEQLTGIRTEFSECEDEKQYALLFDSELLHCHK